MKSKLILLVMFLSFTTIGQDTWELQEDKIKHMSYGGAISFLTTIGVTCVDNDNPRYLKGFLVGTGVGTGVGIVKEGFDLLGFGTPSFQDLGYTFAGSVIGSLTGMGVSALCQWGYNRRKRKALLL